MGDVIKFSMPAGRVFFSSPGGREEFLGRAGAFFFHVEPVPWVFRPGDDLLKLPRGARLRQVRLAHLRR